MTHQNYFSNIMKVTYKTHYADIIAIVIKIMSSCFDVWYYLIHSRFQCKNTFYVIRLNFIYTIITIWAFRMFNIWFYVECIQTDWMKPSKFKSFVCLTTNTFEYLMESICQFHNIISMTCKTAFFLQINSIYWWKIFAFLCWMLFLGLKNEIVPFSWNSFFKT